VLEPSVLEWPPLIVQCLDGALEIGGVPEDDGSRDLIQATGAMALRLESTVTDLSVALSTRHEPVCCAASPC
jgi:hypothetical protein